MGLRHADHKHQDRGILMTCVLDTLLYGSGPCASSKNANAAPSSCGTQEQDSLQKERPNTCENALLSRGGGGGGGGRYL